MEGPLRAFGAVDSDLVFAGEIHPIFSVHPKARVRLDVCRHDDEAQFKQFDGPVPELSRFGPVPPGQLLVDPAPALALELERNMSAIRQGSNPRSD